MRRISTMRDTASREVDVTFALFLSFDHDLELCEHPVKPLDQTLIPSSVLLHAEQKSVQDRIVARKQAMFFEDFFVSIEEGARGSVWRRGCAMDYGVEEFDGYTKSACRQEDHFRSYAYPHQISHPYASQAYCIRCRSWGMAFELAT